MITPCYILDASPGGAVRPPLAGWFARTYGTTSGYFGLKCPAVGPSVDWTMPAADAAGFLQSNGSGTLSFGTPATDLTNAVILAPGSSTRNVVQSSGPTVVPFVCKGAVSQSNNFQEWQDSSGNVLASLSAAGSGIKLILQARSSLDRNVVIFPDAGTGQVQVVTNLGLGMLVDGIVGVNSTTVFTNYNPGGILIGKSAVSSFALSHSALASDVAARSVSIAGGTPWSSAVTNVVGGAVTISGGPANTNNAAGGALLLQGGLPTGSNVTGSVKIQAGGAALVSGSTLNSYVTAIEVAPGDAHGMLAFYGVSPVARQLLATGASHTVDDVITALQNVGLVRQT